MRLLATIRRFFCRFTADKGIRYQKFTQLAEAENGRQSRYYSREEMCFKLSYIIIKVAACVIVIAITLILANYADQAAREQLRLASDDIRRYEAESTVKNTSIAIAFLVPIAVLWLFITCCGFCGLSSEDDHDRLDLLPPGSVSLLSMDDIRTDETVKWRKSSFGDGTVLVVVLQ